MTIKNNKKKSNSKKRSTIKNKRKLEKIKLPLFKKVIKLAGIISIWLISILSLIILYYIYDLPDMDNFTKIEKRRKITFLSNDGLILANSGDLYSDPINYEQIPKYLIEAVLATEDRRFFDHYGVDFLGILRAIYVNIKAKRVVQGASTISQQLAKIAFLNSNRTMKRKVQELIITLYLEHKLTKEQIITAYLNRAYLGSGIYGAPAAAKYYFGKDIRYINLYEASIITGLLKAPSKYSPVNNREISGRRAYQVLFNMKAAGYITEQQLIDAQNAPVLLQTSAMGSLKSMYFIDWIMQQANELITDKESNLIIKTTLDIDIQEKAENTLEKFLNKENKRLNIKQGAIVTLSKTGKILAMLGGSDYEQSPFNRATQAKRQPGSAFKIFVYATAFENGYTPTTIVNDSPIKLKKWSPRNYSRTHLGDVSFKESFAKSINTIAVKTSESIGRSKVISLAQNMGINSPIGSYPSIALGSVEVDLLELTAGYATIANNGYKTIPYGIEYIKTEQGKTLYSREKQKNTAVLSSISVKYMKELLQYATEYGTAKATRLPVVTYAKTGTSQNYKDAWCLGFSQDVVTGIWLGNDDNSSMNKVTGGKLPAMIWQDFMLNLVK